ncbi:DNA adenine methylase [Pontimonas sp.]|nr:DNA adenine methylase [Pontimonas sp.]
MKKSTSGTAAPEIRRAQPLPLLKWAGGKRGLLPKILPLIPEFTGTYFEPFLGAGAVFFAMPVHTRKVGNDYNQDLVEVYQVVRDNPDKLLSYLSQHKNEKAHFYEVRSWDREPDFQDRPAEERAARIIYLNKTCFNGLYRVNSKNQFNVPFADLKNPDFVSEENVMRVSAFLRSRAQGKRAVTLQSGDYRSALKKAQAGDFVYLDPPYDPLSPTSSFVSYHTTGFTRQDQEALKEEVEQLTEKGVPVLLSNSATPFISTLFSDESIFRITHVETNRAIGAASSSRRKASEFLVDNYRATLKRK